MSGSQGIGAFVRREWAQQYADLLARYIAAFVESERRLMSPANQQEAIDIAKDAKLPADIPALLPECGPCVALAVALKLSF
jgi:ABC-type nitrate/sulfonate/bicarbonate transport system substrate-binding protein